MDCNVPGPGRLVARPDIISCTCNSTGQTAMAEGSTAGSCRPGKQSQSPDKPQQQEWLASSLVAMVYKLSGFHQWRRHMLHPQDPHLREPYLNIEVQFDDRQICRTITLITEMPKSPFSSLPQTFLRESLRRLATRDPHCIPTQALRTLQLAKIDGTSLRGLTNEGK